MNLAQSPILPPPASQFIFTPIPEATLPAIIPPARGSYRMKVLRFLDRISSGMAFGNATKGVTFPEIREAIGGEDTLGGTLHRMRKKGFIEANGGLNKTRYRITALGHKVVKGTFS